MFEIELIICIKMDLALNDLQRLICYKTHTTNYSSIVTYLCKNSFLLCWNSCKQCSESSACCFDQLWANAAPTWKTAFSLTIVHIKVKTLLSDIFNSSAILHNFNLPSAKRSLWSILVFSKTTAEFGQPECSASFVSVRPSLKSAYHLLTIVSDRAESE